MLSGTTTPEPKATDATTTYTTTTYHTTDGRVEPEVRAGAVDGGRGGEVAQGGQGRGRSAQSNASSRGEQCEQLAFVSLLAGSNPHTHKLKKLSLLL